MSLEYFGLKLIFGHDLNETNYFTKVLDEIQLKNDPTLQKSLRINVYADRERSNRSDLLGHTPQSHRPHPYTCEGRGMLVTKNYIMVDYR